jgi:hypothetical protein
MRPTRSTSKKRNALEERQKAGMLWSPQLAIVVPTRSWREISWWKTQQTKNSLNFASTCLKVVDTRRTFRLRDSLSECYITGRCLPAMTPRVLVMGDEVQTEENFFRRTITINSFTGRSLSARLPSSLRFFSFPLPAAPSVPSCDGLSSCEERYGLTLFR